MLKRPRRQSAAQSLSDQLVRYAVDRSDAALISPMAENRATGAQPSVFTTHSRPDEAALDISGDALVIHIDVEEVDGAFIAALPEILAQWQDVRLFVRTPRSKSTRDVAEPLARELMSLDFQVFAVDDRRGRWQRLQTSPKTGRNDTLLAVRAPRFVAAAAVLHSTETGGVEQSHLELVRGLQRRGHLVHTLLPEFPPGELPAAIRQIGGSFSTHSSAWWVELGPYTDWRGGGRGLDDVGDQLEAIDPDVVLTHSCVIATGAIAAYDLDLPHVWFLHEWCDPAWGFGIPMGDREAFAGFIGDMSSEVLVNSNFTRRMIDPELTATVVAPITIAASAETSTSTAPSGPVELGIFGRIHPAKGQLEAIRAVRRLVDAGMSVRLNLLGAAHPPELEQLREEIRIQNLADYVRHHGHVTDALAAMRDVDIVLSLGHGEGFGRTAVEAVSLGKPVVYANAGGTGELLTDRLTGLAVPVADPDAIAAAISEIVADGDLWDRLANNAFTELKPYLQAHDLVDRVEESLLRARHSGDLGDTTAAMLQELRRDSDWTPGWRERYAKLRASLPRRR